MRLGGLWKELDSFFGFSVDTMVVVMLLGVELGRSITTASLDTVLLFVTSLMVAALPYALLDMTERPSFAKWLAGRVLVAGAAVCFGFIFDRSLASSLPESFRFLPLSLLILAGMTSCFIQFYALMRLRLAK